MTQLNPFSSCRISPALTRFLAPTGFQSDAVARNLPRLSQISGPHGSGKSSLAFAIGQALLQQGQVASVESKIIRAGHVDWQSESVRHGAAALPRLCIIDGIESVNFVNRNLLLWHLRKSDDFILLTTHRKLFWVPIVYKTSSNLEHFKDVVSKLQSDSSIEIPMEKIVHAYHQNQGNYRIALMQLYDCWNQIKAANEQSSTAVSRQA